MIPSPRSHNAETRSERSVAGDTPDQAWIKGRDAYRADPMQGSGTNPYYDSDANHEQWQGGMTEKTAEAISARRLRLRNRM